MSKNELSGVSMILTLDKIIEAAYHCAYSNEEIHSAIKDAGLDEVSDETIAYLLGTYAESLNEVV